MAFPTTGFEIQTIEATVTWSLPTTSNPDTVTLRFPRSWYAGGVTEACYQQAVIAAAEAFAAAIDAEASIDSITYRYLAVKE